MKKKLLLLTSGLLAILFAHAQTNSDASGNKPNATNTGYIYNFSAGDAENCIPSHVNSDHADIALSISGGILTVVQSNTSDNPGWHGTNLVFSSGNCTNNPLDLSAANGDSVKFVVNSTVSVPQCNVYFCDGSGNCTDNNPKSIALTPGDNTIEFGGFDWNKYNGADPGNPIPVTNTNITSLKIQFRVDYTMINVDGTFTIGNIQVGDQTGLTVDPDGTTSIEEDAVAASINLYPNPTSDELNVSFSALGSANVQLADVTGSVVASAAAVSGQNELSINTSSLASGIYILSVITGDGVVTRKVIVE